MKIAYIVHRDNSAYVDKEHDLLLQFLQQRGLDIHKKEWSDETIDWSNYQCIVLKSPWDYVVKTQLFYQWLKHVQDLNVLLLNPVEIVRWNCDKHYLEEIAGAGLKVIPTSFLERGTCFHARKYFNQFNTTGIIVKPCISGASKNTFRITAENTGAEVVVNELLQQQAMMVQPFIPQVNEEGEWSLVFFNGRFSHALLKTPAAGDFRSQPQFGGNIQGRTPIPTVLDAASRYVRQFAKGCLYARVDGLIIDDEFYLMELELIDPYLFLATHESGYENYYQAFSELIA